MPRRVILHPCCHGLGIANQRGAGRRAHQADPGPEVRADFELITLSAMQLRNALLADRIMRAKIFCALAMVSSLTWRMRSSGRAPGRGIGLAHDDVQPDAEAETPPLFSASAATRPIFSATCAGGSPQVRYLSTVSAATTVAASDDPPK